MGWIVNYTSLVKFEHTLFAFPFAMIGFFMAVVQPGNQLSWKLLGWLFCAWFLPAMRHGI